MEIGVVGLVAGVNGLTVLLGHEGMQDARLEAGGGEGALDEAVVAARAFDGDEAILELVLGEGVAKLSDGRVEVGTVVSHRGGWHEDPAIEIGEEKLGAGLGTVETDDAKVFGADLLHARMEHAAGFGHRGKALASAGAPTITRRSHEKSLQYKGQGSSHLVS